MDKARYPTFGVGIEAAPDAVDGLWPTSPALPDPCEKAPAEPGKIIRRLASASAGESGTSPGQHFPDAGAGAPAGDRPGIWGPLLRADEQ